MNNPFNDSQNQENSGLGQRYSEGSNVSGSEFYAQPHSEINNAEQLNLEGNAPTLATTVERRLNKNAIVFLGLIALLGVGGAAWAFKHFVSGSSDKPPAEEIVTIPEMTPTAAAPTSTVPVPLETPLPITEPIAVTTPPVIEELPIAPAAPVMPIAPVDTLLDRRKSDNPIVSQSSQMAGSGNGFFEDEFSTVKQGAVQRLNNRDARLIRGTNIRCVLETKMVSEVKGFTSCIVSDPVYSATGKKLLLPKGTRISGQYRYGEADIPRIEVIWNRALTPGGLDIRLDSPGTDSLGASGHPGDYRTHWGSRLASALMISLVSDAFKVAASKYAPTTTVVSNDITADNPFESNTADTMQKAAEQALSRSANRPATVTINQGTLLNIYASRDIDFTSVLD